MYVCLTSQYSILQSSDTLICTFFLLTYCVVPLSSAAHTYALYAVV